MRYSTVCPVPAGAAIIRDARCWHGGTPCVGRRARAIPNVECKTPLTRLGHTAAFSAAAFSAAAFSAVSNGAVDPCVALRLRAVVP